MPLQEAGHSQWPGVHAIDDLFAYLAFILRASMCHILIKLPFKAKFSTAANDLCGFHDYPDLPLRAEHQLVGQEVAPPMGLQAISTSCKFIFSSNLVARWH